jgi:phosphatidylglycerol:prolipoprotein diacylglycerol transferase
MSETVIETIQRSSAISFPMLGDFSINPPAFFTVFGFDIYLYGVMIGLGFILGILYCSKKGSRFGIKEDDVYDLVIWLIPLSILGARLYYVAFRLDYYLAHPNELLAIWNGGLAIYGGIIAGVVVVFCVCKWKKIPVAAFLDLVVFGLLIGQILGRWGNFFNREAFGAITDVFCRMGLTAPDGTSIYVHPTFLYESLWCLLGALLLHILFKKAYKFNGMLFCGYAIWYGTGRFLIESLRTDSLMVGGLRTSQVVALVAVAGGAALLAFLFLRHRRTAALPQEASVTVTETTEESHGTQN